MLSALEKTVMDYSTYNNSFSVIILDAKLTPKIYPIDQDYVSVGRKGFGMDIELESGIVSKKHGAFKIVNGRLVYTDFFSNLNGTFLNGVKIEKNGYDQDYMVNDGDILRIDSADFSRPHSEGVLMIVSSLDYSREEWKMLPVNTIAHEVIIGRDRADNCITIPRINVSRKHARIFKGWNNTLCIEDLRSMNHTLINGQTLVGTAYLKERDVISICSTKMIFTSGMLIYNVPKGFFDAPYNIAGASNHTYIHQQGSVIQLINLKRTVKDAKAPGGIKTILDLSQVNLTIRPGELVAIIGGSGAGKTTLMNCMNGFEPANSGDVLINGNSLYRNRDAFRLQIGFVPQEDIVHDNLTVNEMLTFAAQLRLPQGLSQQELNGHIQSTLQAVELENHRDKLIRKLSGGQKKRSSIAVEMIADPAIFFLDEPTSGLDPEMEQSLISRLRAYAHDGAKTVVVVTHTLQSITLYDKIIFLAPSVNGSGGRLAFFGSYEETLHSFEVDDIIEAYKKVSNEPARYADHYLAYISGR